jgi:hypothetical protein
VNDPGQKELVLADSPPFKGLIYPFRFKEVHLGVKENLR